LKISDLKKGNMLPILCVQILSALRREFEIYSDLLDYSVFVLTVRFSFTTHFTTHLAIVKYLPDKLDPRGTLSCIGLCGMLKFSNVIVVIFLPPTLPPTLSSRG
jgi:hypothetical protein